MQLHRDGIENVRAVPLPEAVAADGDGAVVAGDALVTWRSSHASMLHQVYVNGRFAGSTLDVEQRRLVVQLPSSFLCAVRIEVAAVEPRYAHLDLGEELDPAAATERVRLVLLRSQTLPLGAGFNVYCNGGAGQIDYGKPLNASPIAVWPCPQDKAGFALAGFGQGDFGYDSAACAGFGKGRFAQGSFGMEADAIEWVSPPLPLGQYRFGVKVQDARGVESPAGETAAIAIVPAARPAAGLTVAALDPQTNQLTLRVLDE